MQKCVAICDEHVAPLAHRASKLELLNLTDCKALRSPRIVAAQLRTLHLYNCVQLVACTLFCPALDLLNLTHCAELAQLSLVCPKLVTLLCAGCKRLPDAQLRLAIRACRNLTTCDVKDCELLSPETRNALEQLTRRTDKSAA